MKLLMGTGIRVQGRLTLNFASVFFIDCKQAWSTFADSKECYRLQHDLDGGPGAYRKHEPSTDKHTHFLTSSPVGMMYLKETQMETTGEMQWPWHRQTAMVTTLL